MANAYCCTATRSATAYSVSSPATCCGRHPGHGPQAVTVIEHLAHRELTATGREFVSAILEVTNRGDVAGLTMSVLEVRGVRVLGPTASLTERA